MMRTGGTLRWMAAAAAVVVWLAGCSSQNDGTAAQSTTALTAPSVTTQARDSFAWLSSVMPTDAELSDALGYAVSTGGPSRVRASPKFRNTFVGSGEVVERDCIGVVAPLEQDVYGSTPAVAVSFNTEAAATYGAVAFDSAGGAQTTFERFADQWHACDGRTVVKSFAGDLVHDKISNVQIADALVSAVITVSSSEGAPVLVGRALGVAHDCVVDVELTFVDIESQELARDRAAQLVQQMLSRVAAA